MWLFRLGGIKRLLLSLTLSFFILLIITSISWYSKPAKHHAYDIAAAVDYTEKQKAMPSDRLDAAIDAVLPNQPNPEVDTKLDYFSYLWDAIFDGAGTAFVAIAAGFFLVLSIINQYLNEVSIGWKRLSLVASPVIAIPIALFVYWDSSYIHAIENGVGAFLLATPITMLVILYSRVLLGWIKEGFNSDIGISNESVLTNSLPVARSIHEPVVSQPANYTSNLQSTPLSESLDEPKSVPLNISIEQPTFWNRLWARGIDVSLTLILASILSELLPALPQLQAHYTNIMLGLLLWMLELCLFTIGYETLFLHLFGATPGKMLFGLTITDANGNPIPGKASLERTLILLRSGLGYMFWFPWMQMFLAYNVFKSFTATGKVKWDSSIYQVRQKPMGGFRWLVAVLVSILMLVLVIGLTQLAKQMTKKDVRQSFINQSVIK